MDLGIVNIATTSTGYQAGGRALNRYRKRQLALRAKLQKKRTKSAKRRLKERSRREQRHVKNTNHIISKTATSRAAASSSRIRFRAASDRSLAGCRRSGVNSCSGSSRVQAQRMRACRLWWWW
ncbi:MULTISPECIES: hypothetical protein [Streptomyces violaceusniger group]|uniref:Transposase n=3 Tax=Streptomyces TaxID=1883 RepID=A0ABP4D703_9ACTN